MDQQKLFKLKMDIQCPICTESYELQTRPPYVICLSQHLVCMPCINSFFKNKPPNTPIQCPMCKVPVYHDKVQKFRFFNQIKQVKEVVWDIKNNEYNLKRNIIQVEREKQSIVIDLTRQKTISLQLIKELQSTKMKYNEQQQNMNNLSTLTTELKKSKLDNEQKQDKLNQKYKIIMNLIQTCSSLMINQAPSPNNQKIMLNLKNIREKINLEENQNFIKQRYNPEKIGNSLQKLIKVRTILGISAKGTMKKVLQIMKSIILDIHKGINDFINNKNLFVKFQIKIMLYRNYNNTFDQLFEQSDFQSKSQKIKAFMDKSDAKGQWQTQAIEVLLQKVNNFSDVDQLFLIADSEANNQKSTHNKRQFLGEKYWNKHGHPKALFQEELNKAKGKYPIHCIYSNKQEFFQRVSKDTSGNSKYIDIQNLQEPKLITEFICNQSFSLLHQKVKEMDSKS